MIIQIRVMTCETTHAEYTTLAQYTHSDTSETYRWRPMSHRKRKRERERNFNQCWKY